MPNCCLCGERFSGKEYQDYCKECEKGLDETIDMIHPDENDEEFWEHEDYD